MRNTSADRWTAVYVTIKNSQPPSISSGEAGTPISVDDPAIREEDNLQCGGNSKLSELDPTVNQYVSLAAQPSEAL